MRHARTLDLQLSLDVSPPPPPPAPTAAPGGRRHLVVALPTFRLERMGWGAEDLVVLAAEERNALRVQVVSRGAAREGLRVGMALAEARAILPELAVERMDPPALERADLQALLGTMEFLSPQLRALPPQALALELTPMLRRPGADERRLLASARAHVEGLGHACQLAIADDVEGAAALASWWPPDAPARDRVVPPGGLARALAPLPLEALGVPPGLLERLELPGLRRVADLAALDAASVSSRFGREGLRLHRLARGQPTELPIPLVDEPGELSLGCDLPSPCADLGAVLHALEGLAEALCDELVARELAAVRLQVRLGVEGGADLTLPLRLGRPQRAPQGWMRLLRERLAGLQLAGEVGEVALSVLEATPFTGEQRGLLDRSGVREPMPELIARLTDALGPQALLQATLTSCHRPEAAWSATPVAQPLTRIGQGVAGPPRPPLLLRDPTPLRAEVGARGEPVRVEVEGSWREVRRCGSLERLSGAWWEPAPYDRDLVRVELHDGRCLWIFKDRMEGGWWLQGAWG